MKIKRKVEMNLPQLIEWAWENDVRDESFECKEGNGIKHVIYVNSTVGVGLDSDDYYEKNDSFAVEVEEEITEDKWFPELLIRTVAGGYILHEQGSINDFKHSTVNDVEAFYIPNDDLTMTLIWRDGRLIE